MRDVAEDWPRTGRVEASGGGDVCVDGRMDGRTDGWTDGRADGRADGLTADARWQMTRQMVDGGWRAVAGGDGGRWVTVGDG